MTISTADKRLIEKMMFRLLPVQILLSAVGTVNGIVSSFFAANYVGIDAMTAVGLYGPIGMLVTSVSTVLTGGSAILCGKYMGQNEQRKMQNVFSLNLSASLIIAIIFIVTYVCLGFFDLTGFLTDDLRVRAIFNIYLLGQAVGIIPLMLGSSFASFLSMENRGRRTMAASIIYIIVNVLLNFVFVRTMKLEALGLALASSFGMWVFLLIQAEVFITGKSHFHISRGYLDWKELRTMFLIGLPGAAVNLYQTIRGLIVNKLITVYVGSAGISAFAAVNNFLGIFWAIPAGMLAVSRMMISVSTGEEDRQTLTDVMRIMFTRFIPIMCMIVAGIILLAVPLTRIFYRDPSEEVYMMTVNGSRILPLCMPLSIIAMHFTCYGQTSGKQVLVHTNALLEGAVCVSIFTALLIPFIGMNSVYVANVLNGIVSLLLFFGYACYMNRHIPRNIEELMVIPEGFGVSKDERLDLTITTMEEVVMIAEQTQQFCLEHGVGERRSYLSALFLEEMAGNVVSHGFVKDRKPHRVDIRVILKGDDVILRIRDDCIPFDPSERQKLTEHDDPVKNIGIKMMYRMAKDIKYQNILGMNVLMITI
ncbi:MAG: ATP-binding protein [Solobacterium sp.]|nr:ATP-binding protein [Solobacterium sp.]